MSYKNQFRLLERTILFRDGLRRTKGGRCPKCGRAIVRKELVGRKATELFAKTGKCKKCQKQE